MHFRSHESPFVPLLVQTLKLSIKFGGKVTIKTARYENGLLKHNRSWEPTISQIARQYVPEIEIAVPPIEG
jgi:hypothetical protein